jgi:hypothetical protein
MSVMVHFDERQRRWRTPTGQPCPRAQRVDGSLEGPADCHGCGFCLLLAGLVDAELRE